MQAKCPNCHKTFSISFTSQNWACPDCGTAVSNDDILRQVDDTDTAFLAEAWHILKPDEIPTQVDNAVTPPASGVLSQAAEVNWKPIAALSERFVTQAMPRALRGSLPCAVCGGIGAEGRGGRRPSSSSYWGNDMDSARDRAVERIMEMLSLTGNFSVGGLEQFWTSFKEELCPLCQLKLDSISTKKRRALKLLEEAVKLDRGNKAAKRNLDALKTML